MHGQLSLKEKVEQTDLKITPAKKMNEIFPEVLLKQSLSDNHLALKFKKRLSTKL